MEQQLTGDLLQFIVSFNGMLQAENEEAMHSFTVTDSANGDCQSKAVAQSKIGRIAHRHRCRWA